MKHYRLKHSDRDLPDGLLARIPSMSHDELHATLTQLASAVGDSNSCVQLSRSEGDNADSDGTQDLEVDATCCTPHLIQNHFVYWHCLKKSV